jgi:hypothetical protein
MQVCMLALGEGAPHHANRVWLGGLHNSLICKQANIYHNLLMVIGGHR